MAQKHKAQLLPRILLLPAMLLIGLLMMLASGCMRVDVTVSADGCAPADVIAGYPVVFRAVYATGENNDTPVRYSFIELYNTSDRSVKLGGKTIQYAGGSRDKYTVYALPEDAVIEGHSSYLIRCAAAENEAGEAYIDACERFSIALYDADLPTLRLSSKRCRLLLADTDRAQKQEELSGGHVLAYFGACSDGVPYEDFPFPTNSFGLDKNTVIMRTPENDAFLCIDYSKESCFSITQYTPSASAGQNTEIPLSGVQVTASVAGGRYSDTVAVTLSTLPGYEIVYSMDCADSLRAFHTYSGNPIRIRETTAQQYGYTAGLLMDKYGSAVKPRTLPTLAACVLRACVTDGKRFGPVMTETYFVSPEMKQYDDILIMNITLDPDDFTGSDGIYAVVSDNIFAKRERCDGFLEIFGEDGTTKGRQYVQLAMNGNGSLAFRQKSMRVYVREEDTVLSGGTLYYDLFDGAATDTDGNVIDQYKSFLLRNSGNDASCAHFRDALMQDLSRSVNACIQAYRPSLLFINGEFWGLYNIRERYDENYFAAHFGILPENLTILETISPLLTGSWNTKYELNTGVPGDEKDFYSLVDYVAEHDMKDAEAFAYVEARMDLDNFMDFFIASCYLANTDWPGNNIKVWRNKSPDDPSGLDTRWRWVLSDMDFGIGHSTSADQQMFTHALTDDTVCGKLMHRLLKNSAYRLKFADRATELCNTIYQPEVTLPMLEAYKSRIEPHIEMNFLRWRGDGGSMDNWNSHIDRIEYFLEHRQSYFLREMEKKLNVVIDTVTMNADHARLTINDRTSESESISMCYRDSTKVTVTAEGKDGYRVVGMNVKIGPRETYVEGNTYSFEVYAKTTISVVTEKE